MQLGHWQLDTVSGGRFRLDGGAMFGIVPKPLWNKAAPADELNRIQLATNCVLARCDEATVLIDTGYGTKLSEKEQGHVAAEPVDVLVASLAACGVSPEKVDVVLFSHLHFDHAGGATRRDPSGAVVPTFPNARFAVGDLEWEDATSGALELQGTYPEENLAPLGESGRLWLLDDGEEVAPGLRVERTGGHTRGHQVAVFSAGGDTAAYLGDLCPTSAHMRRMWCMAYDTHPLVTRIRKPEVLSRAVDGNWLILWDHDPAMAAARIARDDRKEFVVTDQYATL